MASCCSVRFEERDFACSVIFRTFSCGLRGLRLAATDGAGPAEAMLRAYSESAGSTPVITSIAHGVIA